jgi:hypothetical protein
LFTFRKHKQWFVFILKKRYKVIKVTHDVDYASSEEDGQVSNVSDEDPSEFSSSDHGGHDYRQPKRRSSAKYFGASECTTKEWKIPRASGNISDPDKANDDVGKPRFRTKPSRRKAKWSSNLGQRQVKAGINMLQDQEQAQEFKSLELPDSIAYLGPKLRKGKAFEDAELWANAACTCGPQRPKTHYHSAKSPSRAPDTYTEA